LSKSHKVKSHIKHLGKEISARGCVRRDQSWKPLSKQSSKVSPVSVVVQEFKGTSVPLIDVLGRIDVLISPLGSVGFRLGS